MAESGTESGAAMLVQVYKGRPDAEELAALIVVLSRCTAATGARPGADPRLPQRRVRQAALWRRPERSPGFTEPRTWQFAGREPI